MDNDTVIACPIGRMQYIVDFEQAAENRDEISKMETYIQDLKIEREKYKGRSIEHKKKKIAVGKASF